MIDVIVAVTSGLDVVEAPVSLTVDDTDSVKVLPVAVTSAVQEMDGVGRWVLVGVGVGIGFTVTVGVSDTVGPVRLRDRCADSEVDDVAVGDADRPLAVESEEGDGVGSGVLDLVPVRLIAAEKVAVASADGVGGDFVADPSGVPDDEIRKL